MNTIILLRGAEKLTDAEYKKFQKADTILGDGSSPDELKRWNISEEEEAKEELKKHRCSYKKDISLWHIEEYYLQYCQTDEDGEFVSGSDYNPAEEEADSN